MIYFDNSATTAALPEVLDTYRTVSEQFFGNPSSLHAVGGKANDLLQSARGQIADLILAQPNEIFFTSGGTEGDNWVLKGTAMAKRQFGKHLITTSVEHPAILNTMKQLESLGFEVTYLPVDAEGRINPADLKAALRKDTILVSVMAVNNEVGAVQPLSEIAEILTDYPSVHFHVDAVQAIGKGMLPVLRHPRVDFITFSGHKFHAPRGTGFIYAKANRHLEPLMAGGGQEHNERSGTENTPAIAAMAKALRVLLTDESRKIERQQAIRTKLYRHIDQSSDTTMFSGLSDHFAPHILTFAIEGVRGETIVHAFEAHDIYISTTSACSSKKGVQSSTLTAMRVPDKLATSAVRVSLDEYNTLAEADAFLKAFDAVHADFQKLTTAS